MMWASYSGYYTCLPSMRRGFDSPRPLHTLYNLDVLYLFIKKLYYLAFFAPITAFNCYQTQQQEISQIQNKLITHFYLLAQKRSQQIQELSNHYHLSTPK